MISSKLTLTAAMPISSGATGASSSLEAGELGRSLVGDPLNDLERLALNLAAAAEAAAAAGIPLEDFMRQAWAAFVDSRPGLREHLADAQLMQQIQELRSAGKVGVA
jgi:hypothetical protein